MQTFLFQKSGAFIRGPTSATNEAIALFDGTSGRLIKNSVVTINAGGVSGITTLSASGFVTFSVYAASRIPFFGLGGTIGTSGDFTWDNATSTLSVSADLQLSNDTISARINSLVIQAQTAGKNISLTVSGAGLIVFPVGTISATGVGSSFTQWNVDNLRLDGNTLSSTNAGGNIVIAPNGVGVIQLSSSTELGANTLFLGSSNQGSIAFSTNLIINPTTGFVFIGDGTTPDGLRAESIGLGDTSSTVSAVRIININANTSGFSNGMFCSMTFSGATATARAMNMTMSHAGNPTNPAVVNVFTATHTNDSSGTTTMQGVRGQASNGVAISQGTKTYHGLAGAASVGSGHTGGALLSAAILAVATTGSAGSATWTDWGVLSEGDIQVNTGLKIYLEGSTTAKGDSYLTFNNSTTENEIYTDNTLSMCWDNDENRSELKFGVLAGTSTTYARVGGTIDINTTAVGNVGGGEDDLITFSVPANSMATNGDSVYFEMAGTYAANGNTKRVRVKYGATTLFDTTALAINNGKWTCRGRIVRTGATAQNYYGEFTTNNTLQVSTSFEGTAAETLSGGVTLKATGESGGSATDDVRQTNNFVRYEPNE